MRKIQVLATRPYGHWFPIISWLIRLMEWSKQSHVIVYFPEIQKLRHAHFNTFKEESIDEFMEKNRLVNMKTILLNDTQYAKVDEYTKGKLGKQSGYFSTLFGQFIPTVGRLFKARLNNWFYKGMTCSEFVRESLRKADEVAVFLLTHQIPKGTFTTDDAISLASQIPNS